MTDLEPARRRYAEEIRRNASISNEQIIEAFASVPREKFLGPGPWWLGTTSPDADARHQRTPDDSPEHLYQDVLVAIDAARELNNGLPSWLARAMDHARIGSGDSVAHIGSGVGYYSAILAHIVGPTGSVLAIEVDEGLAARARRNLSDWPWVTVVHADGSSHDLGPRDVIFVNAGATHVQMHWVNSLRAGGRLVVPLTYAPEAAGQLLRIERTAGGYAAELVLETYVYPCIGSRDDAHARLLREAVERHGWELSGSLRLDPEHADGTCWLRTAEYWLSTTPPAAAP
ncbi:MAG TPA: rRNA adenine N-6-methyltransferase family protein [Kofleriaceae bacterium]|nr:rRNA adenine N-6-methyltransferase family protein [Kofleriaceae bacterium]